MPSLRITAQLVDGEVWMAGTAGAYTDFAEAIESGLRGTYELPAPVDPTGSAFAELAVVETTASRVTFRPEGELLVVAGSPGALAINLKRLGEVVGPGGHTHWDYFEGHPLVDEPSVPMVVDVILEDPL